MVLARLADFASIGMFTNEVPFYQKSHLSHLEQHSVLPLPYREHRRVYSIKTLLPEPELATYNTLQ